MRVIDLFSKRQKRFRGEVPEVYQYNDIPSTLRIQIVHIIEDSIGKSKQLHIDQPAEIYKYLHKALCREYGTFSLLDPYKTDKENLLNHFLTAKEFEKAIDVIEITFKYLALMQKDFHAYKLHNDVRLDPDSAIQELNHRLKEHGVGYQFESGEIIRVDSTYVHSEIVKPTLPLLSNPTFKGANDEFLNAHEHYRHGRNKECLTECLKAFESTMKIICTLKKWPFNQNDTAKKLIQICFQNNLVPSFTQNQFTSLQNSLESGIPTIRNKLGGHGQGAVPQKVDDEMTRYALNLAGTNIVFLIEQSGLS